MTYRVADMALWQGRIDGEPGGERWHQVVAPFAPPYPEGAAAGVVLLGVASDAGVRRNLGRPGARKGPDAIRAALANLAWHLPFPLYDAGNLQVEDDDLEGVQGEQAEWVARLLDLGHLPIVLGGGHEISLGSHAGLALHLERHGGQGGIGVINFDAHFDLRPGERSTSGTPFRQIAERCRAAGTPFRYLCLGVSEAATTVALFRGAESLGARWLLDEEVTGWRLAAAEEAVRNFLGGCEALHLSIDLDVLPASVAPGVSAPAAGGVALEVVEHLVGVIRRHAGGRLKVVDIAECNPDFDIDGRTAKVAARLCHLVARRAPADAL